MARKRVVKKSRLDLLKTRMLKHKGAIATGVGAGLAGAVIGAGYGASVVLNKMRNPKDIEQVREAIFGIPKRVKETIEMENIGNKYRRLHAVFF